MHSTVVVLPDPFGPKQPEDLSGLHLEGEVAQPAECDKPRTSTCRSARRSHTAAVRRRQEILVSLHRRLVETTESDVGHVRGEEVDAVSVEVAPGAAPRLSLLPWRRLHPRPGGEVPASTRTVTHPTSRTLP